MFERETHTAVTSAAPPDPDCTTIDALAEMVGVSRQFLYNAINSESDPLPTFTVGRRRFVRLSTWREFCQRREAMTVPPARALKKPTQVAA